MAVICLGNFIHLLPDSLGLSHGETSVLSVSWLLSVVYDPIRDEEKVTFLQELHELSHSHARPWLLTGDFNLIYRAEDKSNARLNIRRMRQFCQFLNSAALKDLHLRGRLFTWSNEWVHLTLECID
jgi:hypothetical protein